MCMHCKGMDDTRTDLVAAILVEQNSSDRSNDYNANHNGNVGQRLPQLGVPFSSTVMFERRPQTAFNRPALHTLGCTTSLLYI